MISKFEKAYMKIISEMSMSPADAPADASANVNPSKVRVEINDNIEDNEYYSDGDRQCNDYDVMGEFYDEEQVYEAHDEMFSYKDIILDAYFDEPDYMYFEVNMTDKDLKVNILATAEWEKAVDNSKNRENLFNAPNRATFKRRFYKHDVIDFVDQYKFVKFDNIETVKVNDEEIDIDEFEEQYPELYNQFMNIDPTKGKNAVFGWSVRTGYLTFRTVN